MSKYVSRHIFGPIVPCDPERSIVVWPAEHPRSRPALTALPLHRTAESVIPDGATIGRAKLGDADAFATIVDAYYARCLRFARSMLRDGDEAEDVVQEVFVRVYRALPRYEERQRFEPWLFHILGNCCRTANKRSRRGAVYNIDDDAAFHAAAAADTPHTPFDDEWGEAVRAALAELPEHNREPFLLHYVEGFSYDEIERMTGVRRSALKMRVKRASDFMRKKLEGRRHG